MEPEPDGDVEVQRILVVMGFQAVAVLEIVMDARLGIEAQVLAQHVFGTDGGQGGEQRLLVADGFHQCARPLVRVGIAGGRLSADQLFHLSAGGEVATETLALPDAYTHLERNADVVQLLLGLVRRRATVRQVGRQVAVRQPSEQSS